MQNEIQVLLDRLKINKTISINYLSAVGLVKTNILSNFTQHRMKPYEFF